MDYLYGTWITSCTSKELYNLPCIARILVLAKRSVADSRASFFRKRSFVWNARMMIPAPLSFKVAQIFALGFLSVFCSHPSLLSILFLSLINYSGYTSTVTLMPLVTNNDYHNGCSQLHFFQFIEKFLRREKNIFYSMLLFANYVNNVSCISLIVKKNDFLVELL